MRKRRSNAQQFDRSHAPRGNDHKTRNTRRGTQRAPRFLCIQHGRASGRAELQLDFPGLRPAGGITYVAGLMCNPCARLLPIPPSFPRRRESSVASEPDLDPRLRGDDGSKVDCGHDEGGLCVVAADVSAAGRAKLRLVVIVPTLLVGTITKLATPDGAPSGRPVFCVFSTAAHLGGLSCNWTFPGYAPPAVLPMWPAWCVTPVPGYCPFHRHSRAGGNPVLPRSPIWIPAYAGMTEVKWTVGMTRVGCVLWQLT